MRTTLVALAALLATPSLALADPALEQPSSAPTPAVTEAPPPAKKPPPPPYSMPWQLRPTAAATVLRWDTAVASWQDASEKARLTTVSGLLGSYKLTEHIAPMVRIAIVQDALAGTHKFSFVNPVLGVTYAMPFGDGFRLGAFLGVTVPVGMGGGNTPDKDVAATTRLGILTRSAMDNAMFAVNDFTVFPGLGVAYVKNGLTVQAEATVLQLTRVRGDQVQADTSKTNFTSGLHAGYFVVPQLSVGAEWRYQRWLSTPAAVKADTTGKTRDNMTIAGGVRGHFKVEGFGTLRPGLSYGRGLDRPMSTSQYNIVQVDLPVAF